MKNLQGKTVLVTGVTGFLGVNLAEELLARGARVHGLARGETDLWRLTGLLPQIMLHRLDLTDAEAVEQAMQAIRPDLVYHLAVQRSAVSRRDRLATWETNVTGTLNLLEAAASSGCERLVVTGSSLEYGPQVRPTRETDLPGPASFFGTTKAAATLLCQQLARERRLPLVLLRIYSVYGYWEGPTRLIPTAILAAMGRGELALTGPGFRRDLVFIEDVVEACLLAASAEKAVGEVINIGSGQQWTNEQVVEEIESIAGCRLLKHVGAYSLHATDTTFWVADNRKAGRVLQWKPRHPLRNGLEKTWSWFEKHRESYRR